ncbi:uncharacterized protein Z520_11583 [Fonsecaea multimorphosa CBS 102226]|uniref:Parasitic phase-specific protein PSP-1 n=1 Tax=Fonsecaea multimorphosa CBS 102226 TaxID=1442371 RepID=A0A0D2I654_9EURO|nr:uncharacterized protein Z520_11583 [Fonsecaea multimorphosa CBS 102226]KIX92731.1 hypothetical protein Z520_11583 [Fonsecaea multimorphosa CBS 102226]OAL17973.1 hypothetical protein AYO22_11129 [Fonsecaea multimorphosa]
MTNSHEPVFITPNGTLYIAGGHSANCTISVCPIELSVYGYRPSLGASGVFIALYALCMVAQAILGWRYKTWGFMSLMLLGCVDEIIGYVGRILYWQNPWAQSGFIIQIVLITIGPVFFSAAIYVLLAQIVRYISIPSSRFAPKYFYWIFIPCDIVSLVLQAAGGAISSTSDGGDKAGVDIALAGLAFQVFTLTAFVVLAIDYAFRSRAVWLTTRPPIRFVVFSGFLFAATILILIRCCYRVYELSGGYERTSQALRDQTLFIVFESVMVILASICLIPAHPGFVFKTGLEQLVPDESSPEKAVSSSVRSASPSSSAESAERLGGA